MLFSRRHLSELTRARTVGGTPSIYITNRELAFLVCLVCRDLQINVPQMLRCQASVDDATGFYEIPVLSCVYPHDVSDEELDLILNDLIAIDSDIFTYFITLTSLHSQRRKYHAILEFQSIPELETIIPRGLLDLGALPADRVASWILWRKFIYDIDNRAAQTTGYLFEPILAASIGGVSYSASKSPVKREGVGSGRQVDCIVGKDAYEFKMRVTIAASGQGRFGEELSYAKDCAKSGYKPILLVLDPTPSIKLEELSAEFRKFGGEAYIGDSAWAHLEDQAGNIMAQFLERYVRQPIQAIDSQHTAIEPISLEFDLKRNNIRLTIGNRTFHLGN